MDHSDRSDAELIRRAQNGEQRAFAVLLHRHGPAVRATVQTDRDPAGATIATFVSAMRALTRQPPDQPAGPWLVEIAQKHTRRPDLDQADDPPPIDPDELDEIWAELDLRWPNGRVPRSIPRWVGWAAMVVVLVALAVLIPYLALTTGTDDDQVTIHEEVVARPYDEPIERERAEELFDPGEEIGDTGPDMPELDVSDDGPDDGPDQTSPTPTDPAVGADPSPDPPTSPDADPQPDHEPRAPQDDPPPADDPVQDDMPPPDTDTGPESQTPPATEAPSTPEAPAPDVQTPGDDDPPDDQTPPEDPPEPGAGGGNMVASAVD